MPAAADSAEGGGFPTTSPEDAARIILDGIEDDQFHIYVGRDSRMTTLLKRPRPAVPST